MARSAHARGSAKAARSAGSEAVSGTTLRDTRRAGRRMNSPYAPLTNRRSSQRFGRPARRSEEHTSELQSRLHLVCRLLLEKKKKKEQISTYHTNNIKR